MQLCKTIKLAVCVALLILADHSTKAQVSHQSSAPVRTKAAYKSRPQVTDGPTIIPTGYYVLDSAVCDLNKDGHKDKILVMVAKNKQEKANKEQRGLRFVILKGNANGGYRLWDQNDGLFTPDDKCSADGYQKLVIKGSYFTIEGSTCAGWLYVHQFITFRYDDKSDKIVLHKYSEGYTDRTDPDKEIPDLVWDKRNFQALPFNLITDDLIYRLRSKRPRNK